MKSLYKDVYLREEPERLVFGNEKLGLEFDSSRGEWLSLVTEGIPENALSLSALPAADFRIDGAWHVERHGATLLRYETSVDKDRRGVSLRLHFGVSPKPAGGWEYELSCAYTLFPGEGRLDRSVRLTRHAGEGAEAAPVRRLEGFLFRLPGVSLGDPDECVVNVPGPWFPKTYVAPDTPYAALKERTVGFHGAPDGGFGVLAVGNKRRNVTLAAWMDTGGEVHYRPSLQGDGKRITFLFNDQRLYRLPERAAVDSDTQVTHLVAGPLPGALAEYRKMATRTMPLDPETPAWVREMVLLEVYPAYYPGGFKGIAERLPVYREVGFNTVYLMPHWVGGYSPIDPYRVEPSLGTPEDLRGMVREAHRLGMRVLFDMVIHGFNEKSPLMAERPDLFIHDERGDIVRHPAWKSMSTDWASPAYRQYMVDLVQHDLKEYDIDGYRVDAASYKGASWDPKSPSPAYRSGAASPELMRRMIEAMRKVKPDAVLLSEVFGPVFYTASNLAHDNQTEAVQQLIERMDAGEATAADYKAHLANVLDLLPEGANRVYFARNHDTSWFYHFNGYTPRFMAMDAVHALCAIPEVFAGDPKNGPHPDDDPATYAYYRKLFALRTDFPELARGALLLRAVACDNPWVFTALRRLEGRDVLVLVSLSDKPEAATVTLSGEAKPRGQRLTLRDPIAAETLDLAVNAREPQILRLTLKPFQALAGRL